MSREVVVQCKCDRCGGVFTQEWTGDDGSDPETKIALSGPLVAKLFKLGDGEKKGFTDLCSKCADRVASLLKDMFKAGKGKGRKPKTTTTKNTKATSSKAESAAA